MDASPRPLFHLPARLLPLSGDDGLMEESGRAVTIVTGGGRGIGAAVVERLASIGHAVVIAYQHDCEAAARVAASAALAGAPCIALKADVTSEDDVHGLFACALERFGTVTGLVNNAGLTAHIGDLADTPVEVIRRVIDVNLLGVVLCARQAARVMPRRRGDAAEPLSTSRRQPRRSGLPMSMCTTRQPRPRSTRSP